MNKKVTKIIIAILTVILSFSIMIIFREENISQVWNKTRIAIFNKSYNLDYICSVLDEADISYVCKTTKKINLFSDFVPVNTDEQYFNFQNKFFTDSSENYNIFYFPDISTKNFKKVLSVLKKSNISFSTDSKTKNPYMSFIFFVIVFFVFLYFTKSKTLFTLCSLPLFVFCFSCPFWTQTILSALILFIIYNFLPDIKRKNFFSEYLKNFSTIVYCFTIVIVTLISGIKITFFLALCLSSSLSVYFLYLKIKEYYSLKKSTFEPILILQANAKNNISKNHIILSCIPLLLCFIALFSSLMNVSLFQNNDKSIEIPSPKKSFGKFCVKNFEETLPENKVLPDMCDYIEHAWNTITMPYRSFNTKQKSRPALNETIHFTDYIKTKNGIAINDKILYTFNDEFLQSSLSFIDSTYPVIEKVLLNQGHFCKINYSVMTKGHNEAFMTLKILIILLCSAICLIYSVIFWRKNGFKQ